MDLIGSLASQLNLPEGQAKGLAGGLMKLVQGAVKEEVSEEDAAKLANSIPEAEQWRAEGKVPEEASGGLGGGLLGAGLSMLGGSGGATGLAAGVGQLIQKFGLEPSHAAIAAPMVVKFLESKLDPSLLAKVQPVLAMMSGMGGKSGGGGAGGLLGGLLG